MDCDIGLDTRLDMDHDPLPGLAFGVLADLV